MSETNAEIIHRYFDASNRRAFTEVMDIYAEDVRLVLPAEYLGGGEYAGRTEVGAFFGDWFQTFDGGPHFTLDDVLETEDQVAVAAEAQAKGGRSGIELSTHYYYVFRIRDGRITHMQMYDDWPQALVAAGLAD